MFFIYLGSFLLTRGISYRLPNEDSSKSLCDDYQYLNCIEYTEVKDKFANSTYVGQHQIHFTRFTYESTSENSQFPLSNAFDSSDSKTYWAASIPNNDTFHNSIIVKFKEPTMIEAVLYYPSFITRDSGKVRIFNGSPTKLKIYTSINDNMFQLEAIYVGTPGVTWNQFQFVFGKPILCDKIKLEFVEVTADNHTSNGALTPVSGGISFIQVFTESNHFGYLNLNGNLANQDYFNTHKIPTRQFTYTSTPSKSKYPLTNAFDLSDKKTYWVSDLPNNDTFHNSITVTFSKIHSIESIVYYPAYNTPSGVRTFQGSPTKMNVYSSINGKELELNYVVYGSPQNGWNEFQITFPKPIRCDKLNIEFVDVTPDNYASGGALHPVVGGLTLIQDIEVVNYINKEGNYVNNTYIQMHKVKTTRFVYNETDGYPDKPLSNAFDNSDSDTYWAASTPNTDTFLNTVQVNFTGPISIEAILYYAAFGTSGQKRTFHGTPTKLNVYTSLNNEQFEMRSLVVGTPVFPMDHLQFLFTKPLLCDKILLEFAEVTIDNYANKNTYTPVSGEITFYQSYNEGELPYTNKIGNYANTNYVNAHKIPNGSFNYTSSPSADGYPLSNAFDDNDAKGYWVARDPNNESFHNYITVTFQSIQAIEAFLLYPSFTKNVYHGTPLRLNVLAAIEKDNFELKTVFVSEPEKGWKHLQFVFGNPIICIQLKIEFIEVTPEKFFVNDGKQHPEVGGLTFLKTEVPEATPIPPQTPLPQTPNPTQTPLPAAYICGENNYRCDIKSEVNRPTHVSISLTEFTNHSVNDNGGAVHIINASFECAYVNFKDCQSINEDCGGGGIYINNEIEIKSELKLENLGFLNCKASYGGAVYIYSSSLDTPAIIRNCKFTSNTATGTKNNNGKLYGGSAVYLHIRDGYFSDNVFTNNKGGGGTLKIVNDFESQNNLMLLDNNKKSSVLISNCKLENNLESSCSIFYVAGKNGIQFYVKNCIFTGDLNHGSHFIDGVSLSKESRKLQIDNCKFSSDAKSALNLNTDNDFLSVDLKNQVFSVDFTNDSNEKKKYSFVNFTNLVFAGSAMVVLMGLVVLIKKRKQNKLNEQDEDSSDDNDSLVQSLI